ncbi:MAG: NAD-dependent epimerase/dehydratase family protein [Chitinophagaceae bacterium]|nr:NAD-dependent epimerase/dehydratase family protein [Rubrivivax sp.]
MLSPHDKIVITGAAGLVGQNLVTLLAEEGFTQLLAIDKHAHNLAIVERLHPQVQTQVADLAEPAGPAGWAHHFDGAAVVVQLHAQIAGKTGEPFERNNLQATHEVLRVLQALPATPGVYLVHASSSVVNSVVDDHYVRSKTAQEQLVRSSGLRHCVLRPTLMFGWFDPKHLGWLARFMERVPVFPIPGHGRYMRQPLYNRDFCRAILAMMRLQPDGAVHDLTGPDRIDYIDMIRLIRDTKGLKTPIVRIPVPLFAALLKVYALFSDKPPFTADQLDSLTAGDDFKGVDLQQVFGFAPTPFSEAIRETFGHPVYSAVVVESPH